MRKREEARIGDALDAHGILNFTLAQSPAEPALPLRSILSFGLIAFAAAGLAVRVWRSQLSTSIGVPLSGRGDSPICRPQSWPHYRREGRSMNAVVETLRLSSTGTEFPAQPDDVQKANRDKFAWDPARFAGNKSLHSFAVCSSGLACSPQSCGLRRGRSGHDITGICQSIGETLCEQVPGNICVVEVECKYHTPRDSSNARANTHQLRRPSV